MAPSSSSGLVRSALRDIVGPQDRYLQRTRHVVRLDALSSPSPEFLSDSAEDRLAEQDFGE